MAAVLAVRAPPSADSSSAVRAGRRCVRSVVFHGATLRCSLQCRGLPARRFQAVALSCVEGQQTDAVSVTMRGRRYRQEGLGVCRFRPLRFDAVRALC